MTITYSRMVADIAARYRQVRKNDTLDRLHHIYNLCDTFFAYDRDKYVDKRREILGIIREWAKEHEVDLCAEEEIVDEVIELVRRRSP